MQYFSQKSIDLREFLPVGGGSKTGARVLFFGEIRGNNHGKEISYLEYEAHAKLADNIITQILDFAKGNWHLTEAKTLHRLGKVSVSECAVVVLTAGVHRKEAYLANQNIIHRIKHEVPIWKKEVYKDGTHIWAANCDHFESE